MINGEATSEQAMKNQESHCSARDVNLYANQQASFDTCNSVPDAASMALGETDLYKPISSTDVAKDEQ